jgi:predicted nucleic acid-binding Zn ribbon protein
MTLLTNNLVELIEIEASAMCSKECRLPIAAQLRIRKTDRDLTLILALLVVR